MGYLIEGYKIMGQEALTWMNQNKATVGTGVSIIGTIVSNILSTKAGAKSARQIDAKQMELGRALNIKEKVALCWKNHIIPGAATVISCGGAAYSENQHVKNFNKVATAYGAVKRLYDSSKIATKEVLGEKKAAEYQHKMDQKYIEEHPEVKKKMSEPCVNPDPSTKQRYYEPVFGEVIFATRDQIAGILKAMNSEMKALPPRDKNIPGRNGVYGVRFCKFYEYGAFNISEEKLHCRSLMYQGFNKGKESNGSDDDIIDVTFSPMIINEDTDNPETCFCIDWVQDPGDMAYGDYAKF